MAFTACSSDDDSGGGVPPGGMVDLQTLSGRIAQPGGTGLPGVTVRFEGRETITDASGDFIIPQIGMLATGDYLVDIDGTTVGSFVYGVSSYPELEVIVTVAAGDMDLALPQVITLPDLNSPDSVADTVAVDGTGATTADLTLTGPDDDIVLDVPMGTVVTVGGSPATIGVDFNVTPVIPSEVPMPLPDGLIGSSFVTIQPGNGAFAAPGGGGLDVTLPNDGGLPIGAMVDIWSFDHDAADWVNRSMETGNQGTVVELSPGGTTVVQATGVITEGGWHSPVQVVDPKCATTITGRVVDGMGTPLEGISVFTSLGNFTSTDATGTYVLSSVAAYDLAEVECVPMGLTIDAAAPPLLGSVTSEQITLLADDIVPGGTTMVDDIALSIPTTGCVSGLVNGTPAVAGQAVTITGPTNTSVVPGASGTFFTCGLDPGSYTASYLFKGEAEETVVAFDVVANGVATVTLQVVNGGGTGSLVVNVVSFSDGIGSITAPVEGAQVFAQGTDAGSSAGLLMITDAAGTATFADVDGPFNVTAWRETTGGPLGSVIVREAASLVGIQPAAGVVTILLSVDAALEVEPPVADATLEVTIENNTDSCPLTLVAQTRNTNGIEPGFQNNVSGSQTTFMIPVPSGEVIDLFFATECGTGNTDITGGGFELAIPALTPAETRMLNVDLTGANFVPFDTVVPVTLNGQVTPAMATEDVGLIFQNAATGTYVVADLFGGPATQAPSSWDLPDVSAAALSGFDVSYVVDSELGDLFEDGDSQEIEAKLGSATPASITADLLDIPAVTSPASPINVSSVSGLTLSLAPSSIPSGTGGIDLLSMAGFAGSFPTAEGPKGTVVVWQVFLREGSTSFTFPTIADDIIEEGSYFGNYASIRFAPPAPGYDAVFGENAASNIGALLGSSDSQRQSNTNIELEVSATGL